MAYPANLDNIADTTNGVTDADQTLLNTSLIHPINRTQGYLGTTGDTASSDPAASVTAQVKQLQLDMDTVFGIALWGGGD